MRSALITGAASGIGRATALRLSRAGCAVALFDRDESGVTGVADEIEAGGGQALGVVGDVTDGGALEGAVARTIEEFGGLDATAACAGIEVTGTVESMSEHDWDRALAVNLTGVMLTARHAIPAMVAGEGGAFVAISSDFGVQGGVDWTPYIVSKHGVIGLIRCLALDYGQRGVRSNVVCPSFVKTPMADRILSGSPDEQDAWERLLPMRRMASAEEIANVIHHLLSPEASYTNGLVYMIDGGETAGLFLGE